MSLAAVWIPHGIQGFATLGDIPCKHSCTSLYRGIMRVQAQLGLTDAISRTVQLLTTTLADIGERPDQTH